MLASGTTITILNSQRTCGSAGAATSSFAKTAPRSGRGRQCRGPPSRSQSGSPRTGGGSRCSSSSAASSRTRWRAIPPMRPECTCHVWMSCAFPAFDRVLMALLVGPLLVARQMRMGGRHSCRHPTGCAPMVRVPLSVSLWVRFSLFCAHSCVSCALVGVLLWQPTTSTTLEAT